MNDYFIQLQKLENHQHLQHTWYEVHYLSRDVILM
jgi:hypothetical protein